MSPFPEVPFFWKDVAVTGLYFAYLYNDSERRVRCCCLKGYSGTALWRSNRISFAAGYDIMRMVTRCYPCCIKFEKTSWHRMYKIGLFYNEWFLLYINIFIEENGFSMFPEKSWHWVRYGAYTKLSKAGWQNLFHSCIVWKKAEKGWESDVCRLFLQYSCW